MKSWFGTMSIPADKMEQSIKTAMDSGYFGIDSAWVYKNEEVVGEALATLRTKGYDVKIQTKIWIEHFDDVINTFDQMLSRLKVNKVYSLLLHRPTIDFNKTIKAWKDLIELQKQGKVEHIGVSNFDKDMIGILIKETGVKPEYNQVEMSISNFRHDRMVYCHKNNIEIQAWSPMGHNVPKNLSNLYVLELASKYKVSASSILLSFLTTQGIVPCSSASETQHIKDNINFVKLTENEINELLKFNVYDNRWEETFSY